MNWISVERVKCLISTGVVFASFSCFSTSVFSSTISSNWHLVLPKNVAAQKALLMKGNYKWVQESLSVSAEIPTVFQNVDADIGYEVKGFAPAAEGGGWNLNLSIPSVTFKANSFNMNGTIERNVGGTKVRVNIRATCTGVQMTAKRPFTVDIAGEFRNPFGINLSSVVWSQDPDLWNITATNCQGPANFIPFVNEQLNKYWNGSADFKTAFTAELSRQVNEWASDSSAMNQSFKDLGATLNLKATEFSTVGANWVFKLKSEIISDKRCVFAEAGTVRDAVIPTVTTATLVVPDGVVTKWAQCLHEMARFKRTDDSSQTSFQTSLMDSPVAQGAVWPDLQRYPSTTKFDIVTSSLGSWTMTPSAEPTSTNYRIQTGILSQFILRNRNQKYVTFWGTFDGQVNLSKVGDNLVLKLSGTPTVAMKYKFDLVSSAITDKTIDVNRLRDEMIPSMKSEQMTFAIPTYEFSQAGIFQATGMTRSGGALNFAIDFTKSK